MWHRVSRARGLTKLTERPGKYKWTGKHLEMPDGEVASMPKGPGSQLVFRDRSGTFMVYRTSEGIYGMWDSHDELWKNEKEFVNYLNKNKAEYVGVD